MRKSKLKDGTPFLGIKVEHFVKAEDFTKHLAEYCHIEDIEFDKKMTKTKAMEILKRGLFFNGLDGDIDLSMYEGSFDALQRYQDSYGPAMKWVEKNYPYLIK